MVLAIIVQLWTGEPVVGSQSEHQSGECCPKPSHDLANRGPGYLAHIAGPRQQRRKEQVSLGVVNEQVAIAMAAIVPAVERELLPAVRLIVGGVDVEGEAARASAAPLVTGDEMLEQDEASPLEPSANRSVLEPRKGGLARQGTIILFPADGLEENVLTQRGCVIAVLVPLGDAEHPLTHHLVEAVDDENRVAPILEGLGQRGRQPHLVVQLSQEQSTRVGGDLALVEGHRHLLRVVETEASLGRSRVTLCHASGRPCGSLGPRQTQATARRSARNPLLADRPYLPPGE